MESPRPISRTHVITHKSCPEEWLTQFSLNIVHKHGPHLHNVYLLTCVTIDDGISSRRHGMFAIFLSIVHTLQEPDIGGAITVVSYPNRITSRYGHTESHIVVISILLSRVASIDFQDLTILPINFLIQLLHLYSKRRFRTMNTMSSYVSVIGMDASN